MDLYIANCTNHSRVVQFRVPELPRTQTRPIGMGAQIIAARDLNRDQATSIVDQLNRFGFRLDTDLDGARGVIPCVMGLGKPVSSQTMRRVIDHNRGTKIEKGREFRQQAAIATNDQLDRAFSDGSGNVNVLEMSIEEQPRVGGEDEPFAEGVRVTRESDAAPKAVRRGRPRRA